MTGYSIIWGLCVIFISFAAVVLWSLARDAYQTDKDEQS